VGGPHRNAGFGRREGEASRRTRWRDHAVGGPRGRVTGGQVEPGNRPRFGEAGGRARQVRRPGEPLPGTTRRAGFGPSGGWGAAEGIARLADEPDPGARDALRHVQSTRARRAGRWKERLPPSVTVLVLRHGRRGPRRQRGVAGPASGPDPEVGSHLGAARHRRRAARRRMERPRADLTGRWASAHRKERRAGGRGGWTGLFGTNVQRRCASARWSGTGGLAGRLAGRRQLDSRDTGFGPGARGTRGSRCRETGGQVKPEARSCFGRAAQTGQPGRRWQERSQADLPGTQASAGGKERRAGGRGGSTGGPARACRKAAFRRGGATREGRRVAGRSGQHGSGSARAAARARRGACRSRSQDRRDDSSPRAERAPARTGKGSEPDGRPRDRTTR
jgi:hypothetical protein